MKVKYLLFLAAQVISFYSAAQVVDVISGLSGKPNRLNYSDNFLYISEGTSMVLTKIDVTSTSPTAITVAGGFLGPSSNVIVGNMMYLADFSNNKIVKLDYASSTPTVTDVVSNIDDPSGLALSGNILYISQSGPGSISKIDITSATPIVENVVTGLDYPAGLALNGNDLYIAEIGGDKISKINITSPTPTITTVSTFIMGPIGIRFNGNDLYIASRLGGAIFKLNIGTLPAQPIQIITGLNTPTDLIFINNDIYFTQSEVHKISKTANFLALKEQNSGALNTIECFPNPTSNFIKVNHLKNLSNYSIFDIKGQQIMSGQISNNEELNISTLTAGLYFIQINKDETGKFIKK